MQGEERQVLESACLWFKLRSYNVVAKLFREIFNRDVMRRHVSDSQLVLT